MHYEFEKVLGCSVKCRAAFDFLLVFLAFFVKK